MSSSVTIDVYADIACPWCYVGRARLNRALDRRTDIDATLRWRPFQLNPDLPPGGSDFRAELERKFGGWERAQQMFSRVEEMGAEEGLSFDFEAIEMVPNTADAHRLILWAEERNGGDALAAVLFRAYFSEGRNVSRRDVLSACAEEAGLNVEAAERLLESDENADAVRESQKQARRRGIAGVPCYVFGGTNAVSGAQPVDVLVEALDAVGS